MSSCGLAYCGVVPIRPWCDWFADDDICSSWTYNLGVFFGMSSCTQCQMQHWVAVHKFECQGPKTGSPGSLDTDSWTFSEVHSPGISRSENHKVFIDFTGTRNVNEVGAPPQLLLNPDGATRMQQKLPSWTLTSDGQQRAKAKKVCWEKLTWKLLSTFGFSLSNPQTVLG